jgi:hypothetical protein
MTTKEHATKEADCWYENVEWPKVPGYDVGALVREATVLMLETQARAPHAAHLWKPSAVGYRLLDIVGDVLRAISDQDSEAFDAACVRCAVVFAESIQGGIAPWMLDAPEKPAAMIGRKGGLSRSPKKVAACRASIARARAVRMANIKARKDGEK